MCVLSGLTRDIIFMFVYIKRNTHERRKKKLEPKDKCVKKAVLVNVDYLTIFLCVLCMLCVIGLSWFIAASSFSCDLLRLHRHIYINNSYFACQLMLFHLSLMLCCNSVAFIRFDVILLRAAISNGYFAVNAYAARVERLFSFNELGGHQIQR